MDNPVEIPKSESCECRWFLNSGATSRYVRDSSKFRNMIQTLVLCLAFVVQAEGQIGNVMTVPRYMTCFVFSYHIA